MEALIILGFVGFILGFLIYVLKDDEHTNPNKSAKEVTMTDLKDHVKEWKALSERSERDMVIDYIKSFEGRINDWNKQGDLLEIDGELYEVQDARVDCYDFLEGYRLMIPNLVYMSRGYYGFEEEFLTRREHYKISGFSLESVQELEKVLSECKVVKSTLYKIKEKFTRITDGWYLINDEEYYLKKVSDFNQVQKYNYIVYKFEDWSYVDIACEVFDVYDLTPCEDPKQTHWKHFLELEMKAKKKRQGECYKFIDEVLQQQQEYNDLQLTYEMMPSAPITDVVSFNNFCKMVSKSNPFEDFEVQNYLLTKQRRD